MPTLRPTAKQQQVLDFIRAYMAEHKSAPTYRQIGKHLSVTVGPVYNFINALEARGLLTRNANESRSIQLVEQR